MPTSLGQYPTLARMVLRGDVKEGEVIAAGSGARGEDGAVHALDVKAGDRILFREHGPKLPAEITSRRAKR